VKGPAVAQFKVLFVVYVMMVWVTGIVYLDGCNK